MGMHLACVMFIDRNVTRIKRLGAEELGREATQSLVILPLPLVLKNRAALALRCASGTCERFTLRFDRPEGRARWIYDVSV